MTITVYFIMINIIAYMAMRIDKKRAQRHAYRISEKTLWTLASIGGSTGAFLGMIHFRHKTKHTSFRIGFAFLMVTQLVLLAVYLID